MNRYRVSFPQLPNEIVPDEVVRAGHMSVSNEGVLTFREGTHESLVKVFGVGAWHSVAPERT